MSKDKSVEKKTTIKNPRIVCLAFHTGNLDYKEPPTPNSEYVVDDSTFVPIAEAIKQLGNGAGAAASTSLQYDFPDGKDDGREIPFSRSSGFKDIAELSEHINNEQNDIKDKISKAQEEAEFRKSLDDTLAPSPENE